MTRRGWTEERLQEVGEGGSLAEVLALFSGPMPAEWLPARLEAALTFQLLHPDLDDAQLEGLANAVVASHPPDDPQAVDVLLSLRAARIGLVSLDGFASWPPELQQAGVATYASKPTALASLAELALADPSLRPVVLTGLAEIPPPRKGKALTRIEAALTDMQGGHILDQWKRKREEKKRDQRWRGLEPQDPARPLLERLENWVWQADERYDIPSELSARERGMYVTMLKELCHVDTPQDWRVAVDYFTDENFHGLAKALADRAAPEL